VAALRRALIALFAVGVVFAALDVALTLSSRHESEKAVTASLGAIIGLSFIGVGVFAWFRRPLNRFGLLMTGVGFAWFLAGLSESNSTTIYTIGSFLSPLYVVVAVHMVLAFPSGRLQTTAEHAIVLAGYMAVLVVRLPYFLLGGDATDRLRGTLPGNALAVTQRPDLADVFGYSAGFVGGVGLIVTVVLLLRKRRHASAAQRRQEAPMLWTGLFLAALVAGTALVDFAGAPHSAVTAAGVVALVAFAIMPYAFLAGLVRSRYSRAGAVGELIERLNDPDRRKGLREALADALGDRGLQLVYWRPKTARFVTYEGQPVDLPVPGSGRAVTEVERDGLRIGAFIHDSQVLEEPELVRAVAGSAALALENERLEAELRARVEELESSRARLLEVSMFERRRLERDLHDGAQQRLVALSLQIAMAMGKLDSSEPTAARSLLDAAREELRKALEELRELARGIHPAILTDRGLGPALQALAERAPLPVDLEPMPGERMPAPVEAAAYFVVAESLTNIVKYAGARQASVRIGRDDGYAVVEVRDDGVGGADPTSGTGLRGLADRVAALDGRLEVHSPPGEGTLVRANIPCASF
jgi:signal transduction histidine kinase